MHQDAIKGEGSGTESVVTPLCRARSTDPLVSVHAEQSGVVSLLHDHEGDSRLVVLLQFYTGLPDGQQLMLEHLRE